MNLHNSMPYKRDKEGKTFYRCNLCSAVVSQWDIDAHHGCAQCGHTKIRPTNLKWWEKVVQIVKHPALWRW